MAKDQNRTDGRSPRLGEMLPRDEEAESQLAACILIPSPSVGNEVTATLMKAGVTGETFWSVPSRTIFEAAKALLQEGGTIDELSVGSRLRELDQLRFVGGHGGLSQIAMMMPSTLHVEALVKRLRDMEKRRAKMRAAWKLLEAMGSGDNDAASAAELEISGAGAISSKRLPPILSWSEIVTRKPVAPPELVEGVLHQGAKMMLGGGSKSFKTWCLLDLGLSVSTGTPWWGMRTVAARVLYVNFELAEWAFEDRRKAICEAKKILEAPGFSVWHLRGYAADLKELLPHFLSQAAGGAYGLVILDPIYKALGERDENANGEVAQLLNEVESLAVRSGAAVVFGHHFSKGNQASKEAKDRVSGAGAWARDPDALITLTPHEEEDCFTVDFVLRNHKPKSSHVIRWKPPCMEIAPGLSPAEIRQPGRPMAASKEEVVSLLGPDGLKYAQWEKAAKEKGISRSTFERRVADAKEAGLVENIMHQWRRK